MKLIEFVSKPIKRWIEPILPKPPTKPTNVTESTPHPRSSDSKPGGMSDARRSNPTTGNAPINIAIKRKQLDYLGHEPEPIVDEGAAARIRLSTPAAEGLTQLAEAGVRDLMDKFNTIPGIINAAFQAAENTGKAFSFLFSNGDQLHSRVLSGGSNTHLGHYCMDPDNCEPPSGHNANNLVLELTNAQNHFIKYMWDQTIDPKTGKPMGKFYQVPSGLRQLLIDKSPEQQIEILSQLIRERISQNNGIAPLPCSSWLKPTPNWEKYAECLQNNGLHPCPPGTSYVTASFFSKEPFATIQCAKNVNSAHEGGISANAVSAATAWKTYREEIKCSSFPGWKEVSTVQKLVYTNGAYVTVTVTTCTNSRTLYPNNRPDGSGFPFIDSGKAPPPEVTPGELAAWWATLSTTEQRIEKALANTSAEAINNPDITEAGFDHIQRNTYNYMMDYVHTNKNDIVKISDQFGVDPALVAGIIASEGLYDYSPFDYFWQDSLTSTRGDTPYAHILHFIGTTLSPNAAWGFSQAHNGTRMDAYNWLQQRNEIPNVPGVELLNRYGWYGPGNIDEDLARYMLSPTGTIATAALVARYYTDKYTDNGNHIIHDPSHLTATDMAKIFGAYRSGRVYQTGPLGPIAQLAEPIMDQMIQEFGPWYMGF